MNPTLSTTAPSPTDPSPSPEPSSSGAVPASPPGEGTTGPATGEPPGGAEDQLLAWLRRREGTELLGDDGAVLPDPPAGGWVVSTDCQIAGVHVPEDIDPGVLARRLLQVNLSDLAAMGAEPAWALLNLSVPEDFAFRHFFLAFLEECGRTGIRLAGGDLAVLSTACLGLTVLGTLPEGGRPVRRSAARPGDHLWVGGTLGQSGAGRAVLAAGARLAGDGDQAHVFLPESLRGEPALADAARQAVTRHLHPVAQLDLGRWLGSLPRAAALDLSDGLGRDLPRMARESGVGARIEAEALPQPGGFSTLTDALDLDPLELLLGGGEDYVLLFALPPDQEPPRELGCSRIGQVLEAERGLTLLRNGQEHPWPRTGWDHLEAAAEEAGGSR